MRKNVIHTVGKIYRITCAKSDKIYIGQTTCGYLSERLSGHFYFAEHGGKTHFANAIRLYGRESFKIEEIEECSMEDLNDRERFWIKKFSSNIKEFGYNMSEGGDGGRNSLSDEVRAKISKTKSGVSTGPCSPERRKAISIAKKAKGYKHSPETLDKIKEKRNAYVLTDKHKLSISLGMSKNKKFKLTKEQVEEIQSLIKQDINLLEIKQKFDISRDTIRRIKKGIYYTRGKYNYEK